MRSNAIILHDCIPKVVRTETGEVIFEKVYASPMKQLGSEVKLFDKRKVPNQPNQTQIQITIERRDPLCAHKQSVHPQR